MTDKRVTVSSANVDVTITDRQSAEIALQIIEPVLAEYLGKAPEVNRSEMRPKTRYIYTAQCPECGHEWERRAENPNSVTCSACNHSFYYSEDDLAEMDVREVVL